MGPAPLRARGLLHGKCVLRRRHGISTGLARYGGVLQPKHGFLRGKCGKGSFAPCVCRGLPVLVELFLFWSYSCRAEVDRIAAADR